MEPMTSKPLQKQHTANSVSQMCGKLRIETKWAIEPLTSAPTSRTIQIHNSILTSFHSKRTSFTAISKCLIKKNQFNRFITTYSRRVAEMLQIESFELFLLFFRFGTFGWCARVLAYRAYRAVFALVPVLTQRIYWHISIGANHVLVVYGRQTFRLKRTAHRNIWPNSFVHNELIKMILSGTHSRRPSPHRVSQFDQKLFVISAMCELQTCAVSAFVDSARHSHIR